MIVAASKKFDAVNDWLVMLWVNGGSSLWTPGPPRIASVHIHDGSLRVTLRPHDQCYRPSPGQPVCAVTADFSTDFVFLAVSRQAFPHPKRVAITLSGFPA